MTAVADYSCVREGVIVPREIVAWLQTLGLSKAIKHPKRDLSNGYLVAEICSRYWPNISMHSFVDRLSVPNKRSNWSALRKAFDKKDVPLSDKLIEGMIACKDQYAESFLSQLYTVLTGRVVREAAPLQADDVPMQPYHPSGYAQRMKTTFLETDDRYTRLSNADDEELEEAPRGKEGVAKQIANVPGERRELPHSYKQHQPLSLLPDTLRYGQNSHGTVVRPIRGSSRAQQNAPSEGNHMEGSGTSQMLFSVSVRPAERVSTLRQGGAPVHDREKETDDGTDDSVNRKVPPSASMVGGSVVDTIESLVRGILTRADIHPPADSASFLDYFLRSELQLDAGVQARVWNTLLSHTAELVQVVRHDCTALGDLARAFLLRTAEDRVSSTTSGGSPRLRSRVFVFFAGILSQLTDLDPYHALSAYRCSILVPLQFVLRRLDYHLAEDFASLLGALVPLEKDTAATLLPELLSSTYDVMTQDCTVASMTSYLLLLRALIGRVTGSPSRTLAGWVPTSSGTTSGTRKLCTALHIIGTYNAVKGLSSESPTLRLAGAALAHTLLKSECPLTSALQIILPLLFPVNRSIRSGEPLFDVGQAMWLRALQERYCQWCMLTAGEWAARNGTDNEKSVEESAFMEQMGIWLSSRWAKCCDYVMAPGGNLKVKALVAFEMACALEAIPLCTDRTSAAPRGKGDASRASAFSACDATMVAKAVVFYFGLQATKELVSVAVAAPSEADPSSENSRSYRGNGVSSRTSQGYCSVQSCIAHHAVLGALTITEMLRYSSPLLLSSALSAVFPVPDGCKDTSRRLMVRATALARERMVREDVALRVEWLYHINAGGRGSEQIPHHSAFISEGATVEMWVGVLRKSYDDIALVTMAAEMLAKQNMRSTVLDTGPLLHLAAKAQRVVLRWFMELPSEVIGLDGALHVDDVPVTNSVSRPPRFDESPENLGQAMAWYHQHFASDS